MAQDPFGFSGARGSIARQVATRISEIAPETPPAPVSALARLDRVAEDMGFPSREAGAAGADAIVRRRREVGPGAQLNVKCPVPVYNRFVRFCDEERLTYWEGVQRLLDLAGVDPQGRRSS
jgi:hypothetical protein